MRRLLLFAGFLTLIGLSTAMAASFSVQTEDITTFDTDVSISVPTTSSRTYFLSGSEAVLPGGLSTSPETDATSGVRSKSVAPGTGTVKSQSAPDKYHSWQTVAASPTALVLNGPASLLVTLTGAGSGLTAALFSCPASATPTSQLCTQIAADTLGGPGLTNNEVIVDFGSVSATIPVGEQLRVQVMNSGTKSWNVQWGYKDNRPSALQVTVIEP